MSATLALATWRTGITSLGGTLVTAMLCYARCMPLQCYWVHSITHLRPLSHQRSRSENVLSACRLCTAQCTDHLSFKRLKLTHVLSCFMLIACILLYFANMTVDCVTAFHFHYCTILMTSLWINISKNSPLLHVQCNMSAVSEDWIDLMWGHVAASIFIEWCMYSVLVSGWRAPALQSADREQWPAVTLTAVPLMCSAVPLSSAVWVHCPLL